MTLVLRGHVNIVILLFLIFEVTVETVDQEVMLLYGYEHRAGSEVASQPLKYYHLNASRHNST